MYDDMPKEAEVTQPPTDQKAILEFAHQLIPRGHPRNQIDEKDGPAR